MKLLFLLYWVSSLTGEKGISRSPSWPPKNARLGIMGPTWTKYKWDGCFMTEGNLDKIEWKKAVRPQANQHNDNANPQFPLIWSKIYCSGYRWEIHCTISFHLIFYKKNKTQNKMVCLFFLKKRKKWDECIGKIGKLVKSFCIRADTYLWSSLHCLGCMFRSPLLKME